MSIYRVTVEGKQYTVNVPNPRERPVRAIVDGEVVEVHVDASTGTRQTQTAAPQPVHQASTPSSTPPASPAPSPNGATEVKAPLPGVVVSVGVAEGEAVERGQQLCVLEAMKMNNPIRATAPGTVREVFISPGQQVEHDAVLMRIGSPAPE